MMFAAMLSDAFRDSSVGIDFNFRTNGKLFNLRRLQSKTKVMVDIVHDLLFADDCTLNTANKTEMQRSIDLFASPSENFGLIISTKKTHVMNQPAPGASYMEPTIKVQYQKLNVTEKFVYLGSTLSKLANINDEVTFVSLELVQLLADSKQMCGHGEA